MALSIKNADVERLAAGTAELTRESKTEAIRRASEDRVRRLPSGRNHLGFGSCFALLTLAFTHPSSALACKCMNVMSVCHSFNDADIVFAGRVERTEPASWAPGAPFNERLAALFPGRELDEIDFQRDITPDTFPKFRELYASLFTGSAQARIREAKNNKDLDAAIEDAFGRGQRATFRIYRAYKGIAPEEREIDVWTSISSCGSLFAPGESYLVYASMDNDGRYSTSLCDGTGRLTGSGADLAYFFFREHARGRDSRVFGFLTSNESDLRPPRTRDPITAPVAHVSIELRPQSSDPPVFTETGREGAFVFDGLAPGEYELSVLNPNFPDQRTPVGPSRRIRIAESACHQENLYIPSSFTKK